MRERTHTYIYIDRYIDTCTLYKYDIPVWCTTGITPPERGVSPEGYALGRHSSRGGVIPVVHHTGMSYLFYYTEQHTKHKRGKIDKHQRFWINTRGRSPRATLLSRGSYSCCTPHRDVIFVLLYRTTYKTQKGEN